MQQTKKPNRVKGPRILGIRPWANVGGADRKFAVKITNRQLMRIPEWVRDQFDWYYGDRYNDQTYVEVIIRAKDELEAAMRFQKLWAGLPKEEK